MSQQLQSSEIKNHTESEHIVESVTLREAQECALRVTGALYRTTDLFSDNEPLKWSLRESAIKILQTISALDQNSSFDDFRAAQRAEKNIREILVTIELAASSAFMARKNFEVLEREYIVLRDLVAHTIADFCSLSLSPLSTAAQLSRQTQPSMLAFNPSQQTATAAIDGDKFSSVTHKQYGASRKKPKELSRAQMSETIGSMSERKGRILRFIQERGSIGIGDIARSLEARISEKTVQRDLNMLVESGLLKKEGERRWRRYFI